MPNKLKPPILEIETGDPEASRKFKHWRRVFQAFIEVEQKEAEKPEDVNKLNYLISFVSHNIFEIIEDAASYDEAEKLLSDTFVQTKNALYTRHALISRKQKESENLTDYLQALKILAKECVFANVTAAEQRDECIRDAFVAGLRKTETKQKVLESQKTKLTDIFTVARVYEESCENASSFNAPKSFACPIAESSEDTEVENPQTSAAIKTRYHSSQLNNKNCGWCGNKVHAREQCPARNVICNYCKRRGHFSKVCLVSKSNSKGSAAAIFPVLASISEVPTCLEKSTIRVGIGRHDVACLQDTGSGGDFIHPRVVKRCNLKVFPEEGALVMANTAQKSVTTGFVRTTLRIHGKYYPIKLTILPNSCVDIILGNEFLLKNKLVQFNEGDDPPIVVSAFSTLKVAPPALFNNLTSDCHPIATKSRRYTHPDRIFIKNEVARLLSEGIIEKSKSPWRAQLFVAGGGNQKKRLVVDYSETINRFTLLDAYPLPRIDDMINNIANYRVFSTIDLRSAYHQILISESDRPYTAFEADGGLYQFCRLPFGVTNGVSCFQREMDSFVAENSLEATFPYLDNITICGKDQADHDANLKKFLEAANKINLNYNREKCEFSTRKLYLLGSVIENGEIKPDPTRLQTLLDLAPPHDIKSLKRIMGFLSYYSKWIKNFSQKVSTLVKVEHFPLSSEQINMFEQLKKEIADSAVCSIDEDAPFTVETDASDNAIAATLNQNSRPVAFFSRTLRGAELKHSSVEKEAQAIIESVRHWRHFLTNRHFYLVTDQKSVTFMFDQNHKGKIKNEKIMRWRMELLCYNFDITYRPGVENIPPDTFSRSCASVSPDTNISKLKELHEALAHPGVTRMNHFIKSRNLPYSIEEVRKINNSCHACSEIKPRFFKPEPASLVKATQPFERLNLDFKGPLPSSNQNKYFLHIVDEYSRFPFVFPVANMNAQTIIKCLCSVFSMFGMPSYTHSDRGSSLMSDELKQFLTSKGISSSRTTPYHPQGNGQVEKGNHTIWRAIKLTCHSRKLPISQWQDVLPDVLHSVRSLLCTATNCTPHERLFNFRRKSGTGASLPSWLLNPGPVLLRRFVRNSKQDPLVDEVDLIEANPHYAYVRFPNGRESTVSVKDLAPTAERSDCLVNESSSTTENSIQDPEELPFEATPQPTRCDDGILTYNSPPRETPSDQIMPSHPTEQVSNSQDLSTMASRVDSPNRLPVSMSEMIPNSESSDEPKKGSLTTHPLSQTRRQSSRIIKPTRRLICEI